MKQKRMAIIMIAIVTSIALLSILNIEVIKIIKKNVLKKIYQWNFILIN